MYFGSVRFFKNLILLCVIILIAVPTALAIRFYSSRGEVEERTARLQAQVEQLQVQMEQLRAQMESTPSAETRTPEAEPSPEPTPEAAAAEFDPDAPAYQALYPDFYAPQPIGEFVREEGVIYLTFDDGPSANTDGILKVLAQKNVKATFFINGSTSEETMRRMKAIVDMGHTLAMHSYTHDYDLIYSSVEDFLGDMYRLFVLIRDTTGVTPTLFRFPGGSINSYNVGIYQELMSEMLRRGFVPCDWNMSAQDATPSPLSRETIINNVLQDAQGRERGIVLFHAGAGQTTTVDALGAIIDELRDMGYEFDRMYPDTQPILYSYRDDE